VGQGSFERGCWGSALHARPQHRASRAAAHRAARARRSCRTRCAARRGRSCSCRWACCAASWPRWSAGRCSARRSRSPRPAWASCPTTCSCPVRRPDAAAGATGRRIEWGASAGVRSSGRTRVTRASAGRCMLLDVACALCPGCPEAPSDQALVIRGAHDRAPRRQAWRCTARARCRWRPGRPATSWPTWRPTRTARAWCWRPA